MATKPDGVYSLYVMRDPQTMQIRYIGISSNPSVRATQHISSMHSAIKPWVLELRQKKLRPVMDILFTGLPLSQAEIVERRLIFFHHSMRPGMLFNCRVIPRKIGQQFAMSQTAFRVYQTQIACDFCLTKAYVRWTEHDERKDEFVSQGWKFFRLDRQHLCPACFADGKKPRPYLEVLDMIKSESASNQLQGAAS